MQRIGFLVILTLYTLVIQARELPTPSRYTHTIAVDSAQALYQAVRQANQRGGDTQIIIAEGVYQLNAPV